MDFNKYILTTLLVVLFAIGSASGRMTGERLQKSVRFLIESNPSKTLKIVKESIEEHPEHTLAVVEAAFSNEQIATDKVVRAAIVANPSLGAAIAASASLQRPGDEVLIQRALRDALADEWRRDLKSNHLLYERRNSVEFWEKRIKRGRTSVVLVIQDALREESTWAAYLGELALDRFNTSIARQAIIQAVLRAAPDQTSNVLEMVSEAAHGEYSMARRYAKRLVASKDPLPVAVGEVYFQPYEALNYSLNILDDEMGDIGNISSIELDEDEE